MSTKLTNWNVGVHATVYLEDVDECEIFLYPEQNQHSLETYGWGGEDKIIVFEDVLGEEDTKEDLSKLLSTATLMCNGLNEINSGSIAAKITYGMYDEVDKKDRYWEQDEEEED